MLIIFHWLKAKLKAEHWDIIDSGKTPRQVVGQYVGAADAHWLVSALREKLPAADGWDPAWRIPRRRAIAIALRIAAARLVEVL